MLRHGLPHISETIRGRRERSRVAVPHDFDINQDMAFRLSDLVIAGFFMNSRRFSTHGRLLLRGGEMTYAFELTGDPSPDLLGRKLEFEVPGNDREPTDEDRRLAAQFRPLQIGTTGEMTATLKRKIFDCSTEEYLRRSELGEPPPTRWEDSLYLEWFSQNGRVLIELPMSKLRFLTEEEIAARDKAEKESFEAEMREQEERQRAKTTNPEIDDLPGEEEDDDDILAPAPDPISQAEEDGEEGYGLIPEELNSDLERKARRMDLEVAGESEDTIKMIEETELMDEMLEKGKQTPLMEFLADLKLPSPASVATEEEAEQSLKLALMKLALAGVAFHLCEHCTIREAYRIFIEEVCGKCGHYRPLCGTGWVQNYCASDYCPKCLGEDPM